ncbi:MAG: twin-arginine translocation signal domain-containing protein, partial [Limisphaerales bacterium]
MNRRHFIGAVTTAAAAGTAFAQTEQNKLPPALLAKTPMVLMAPRPDGAEAVWSVTELCKGRLEWQGDDGSTGMIANDRFGFVPQSDHLLRIRLDGLQAGKKYRVRSVTIAAQDGRVETSPWKSFQTLKPAGATTTFTVWNDTHIHNETIQKLHEVTPSADFLFWNGDTCNDWKTSDLLVPTLLHPGQRDITDGRPLLLAWGNHDVRGP